MGKKYLYVAGDSFSAIGGNSISMPYGESEIQQRRHMNELPSLKPYLLKEEMEKNKQLFLTTLQEEVDSQWTNQLAKLLDLELIKGGAIVGGSNQRSVLKLRNFLLGDERAKDSIVIWQWTTSTRNTMFYRDLGLWLGTTLQDSDGENISNWRSESDTSGYNKATQRINRLSKSDLLDGYYLTEETKLLHSLSESIGAIFLAFDGLCNVERLLNMKRPEWNGKRKVTPYFLDSDTKKNLQYDTTEEPISLGKIVSPSVKTNTPAFQEFPRGTDRTRSDRFSHPVFLDEDYHNVRINLFDELVNSNIIIRPHGYTTWSEALKHLEGLDRQKPQGAWVIPENIYKRHYTKGSWEDDKNKCSYEEYLLNPYLIYGLNDAHPGHQARKLFAEFLVEKINDR